MTVEALAKFGADRLAGMVIDEGGRNAPFRKIVAAALAGIKGPGAVAALIDRRLVTLERARYFIDWEKRKAFSADLAATLSTITAELGAFDPAAAIDRLLRLIQSADAVFERIDDSTGVVEAVYAAAAGAVPQLAGSLPDEARADLAERLVGLLAADFYGLSARAFDGCLGVIPPELLAPVDSALGAAQKALDQSRGDAADYRTRSHRERILTARKAVADRAGDVDAVMALELQRPDGERDTLAVAERLLAAGRCPEALDWARRKPRRSLGAMTLDDVTDGGPVWDAAERDRVALGIRILDAMSERAAAQALRWKAFGMGLDAAVLRDIVAHCPDFGEFEAVDRAFAEAAVHPKRYAALCFFLDWPRLDLAARRVLDDPAAWTGRHYEALLPAAEALAPDHPAAATVLYRALVDDILVQGRSQAYGHAARHLAALDDLAAAGGDAADHATYRTGLRRVHGRKSGFWTLVRANERANASLWS